MDEISVREIVFELLNLERQRQQELGKEDKHSWSSWFVIISDYLGRVASLIWKFGIGEKTREDVGELEHALVKVMAIGVAWLENLVEYILETSLEYTTEPTGSHTEHGEQSKDKGD